MLHSLSFGTIGGGLSELPNEVLNLFTDLVSNPNKKIEFASEIVENGLAGRIKLDGSFNIDAYENAIRKNLKLGKEAKRKKVTFIDMSSSVEDYDDVHNQGGIQIDRYLPKALQIQDAFEQLICDEELLYAIDTIKALDDDLQVEENVFIIKVLEQALNGIPSAIDRIKELCSKYKLVAEQLEVILSSGKTFEEMFA